MHLDEINDPTLPEQLSRNLVELADREYILENTSHPPARPEKTREAYRKEIKTIGAFNVNVFHNLVME